MVYRAVVSCPVCFRQFHVDKCAAGKVAKCSGCTARFDICIAVPSVAEEEALILSEMVIPEYSFFRDGCSACATKAAEILRMAGVSVTPKTIKRFIKTAPRSPYNLTDPHWLNQFFNLTMIQADQRLLAEDQRQHFGSLVEYFINDVCHRRQDSRYMLDAAFEGVLSIEFDPPGSTLPMPQQPEAIRTATSRFFGWLRKVVGR